MNPLSLSASISKIHRRRNGRVSRHNAMIGAAAGPFAQCFIPDQMSESIVDSLEVVDVDHDGRDRSVPGGLDAGTQLLVDLQAVECFGQVIESQLTILDVDITDQ